jgi:hypothetical protein
MIGPLAMPVKDTVVAAFRSLLAYERTDILIASTAPAIMKPRRWQQQELAGRCN